MPELDKRVLGIIPRSYVAELGYHGGSLTVHGVVEGIEKNPAGQLEVETLEMGVDSIVRKQKYLLISFLDGGCGRARFSFNLSPMNEGLKVLKGFGLELWNK